MDTDYEEMFESSEKFKMYGNLCNGAAPSDFEVLTTNESFSSD
jgi:hypothetical protein